jgi:hypothetical protein
MPRFVFLKLFRFSLLPVRSRAASPRPAAPAAVPWLSVHPLPVPGLTTQNLQRYRPVVGEIYQKGE